MSQLDDFATENNVGAGALKNVFKSLLSVPNSKLSHVRRTDKVGI